MPEFTAERAALIFPVGNLQRPIAGADRDKYALLAERLKTVARQNDLDFAEQVRASSALWWRFAAARWTRLPPCSR